MNRFLRVLPVFAALAFIIGAAEAPGLKSGVFQPPRVAPDFSLRGSDGTDFKLSRYRGKVVALGFGYTSCPDVCPTTLFELAAVRKKLGDAARDLQVVYVTVDPERDTAERLRAYLAAFDATFIGATGDPAKLADVYKAYGIQIARKNMEGSATAYVIHHSAFVYLIDRKGMLQALMPFGRSIDDTTHDVGILLKR